jgi:hypothetical protein
MEVTLWVYGNRQRRFRLRGLWRIRGETDEQEETYRLDFGGGPDCPDGPCLTYQARVQDSGGLDIDGPVTDFPMGLRLVA